MFSKESPSPELLPFTGGQDALFAQLFPPRKNGQPTDHILEMFDNPHFGDPDPRVRSMLYARDMQELAADFMSSYGVIRPDEIAVYPELVNFLGTIRELGFRDPENPDNLKTTIPLQNLMISAEDLQTFTEVFSQLEGEDKQNLQTLIPATMSLIKQDLRLKFPHAKVVFVPRIIGSHGLGDYLDTITAQLKLPIVSMTRDSGDFDSFSISNPPLPLSDYWDNYGKKDRDKTWSMPTQAHVETFSPYAQRVLKHLRQQVTEEEPIWKWSESTEQWVYAVRHVTETTDEVILLGITPKRPNYTQEKWSGIRIDQHLNVTAINPDQYRYHKDINYEATKLALLWEGRQTHRDANLHTTISIPEYPYKSYPPPKTKKEFHTQDLLDESRCLAALRQPSNYDWDESQPPFKFLSTLGFDLDQQEFDQFVQAYGRGNLQYVLWSGMKDLVEKVSENHILIQGVRAVEQRLCLPEARINRAFAILEDEINNPYREDAISSGYKALINNLDADLAEGAISADTRKRITQGLWKLVDDKTVGFDALEMLANMRESNVIDRAITRFDPEMKNNRYHLISIITKAARNNDEALQQLCQDVTDRAHRNMLEDERLYYYVLALGNTGREEGLKVLTDTLDQFDAVIPTQAHFSDKQRNIGGSIFIRTEEAVQRCVSRSIKEGTRATMNEAVERVNDRLIHLLSYGQKTLSEAFHIINLDECIIQTLLTIGSPNSQPVIEEFVHQVFRKHHRNLYDERFGKFYSAYRRLYGPLPQYEQ